MARLCKMTTVSIGGGLGWQSRKEGCLNHRRSLLKTTAIILLKYSNLVLRRALTGNPRCGMTLVPEVG
jgi:hypothetical protein